MARDASISLSARKSSTTEHPINSPARIGVMATVQGIPDGIPTASSMTTPYDVPDTPHHRHNGGTPYRWNDSSRLSHKLTKQKATELPNARIAHIVLAQQGHCPVCRKIHTRHVRALVEVSIAPASSNRTLGAVHPRV